MSILQESPDKKLSSSTENLLESKQVSGSPQIMIKDYQSNHTGRLSLVIHSTGERWRHVQWTPEKDP